jgi:hypothetical protein
MKTKGGRVRLIWKDAGLGRRTKAAATGMPVPHLRHRLPVAVLMKAEKEEATLTVAGSKKLKELAMTKTTTMTFLRLKGSAITTTAVMPATVTVETAARNRTQRPHAKLLNVLLEQTPVTSDLVVTTTDLGKTTTVLIVLVATTTLVVMTVLVVATVLIVLVVTIVLVKAVSTARVTKGTLRAVDGGGSSTLLLLLLLLAAAPATVINVAATVAVAAASKTTTTTKSGANVQVAAEVVELAAPLSRVKTASTRRQRQRRRPAAAAAAAAAAVANDGKGAAAAQAGKRRTAAAMAGAAVVVVAAVTEREEVHQSAGSWVTDWVTV